MADGNGTAKMIELLSELLVSQEKMRAEMGVMSELVASHEMMRGVMSELLVSHERMRAEMGAVSEIAASHEKMRAEVGVMSELVASHEMIRVEMKAGFEALSQTFSKGIKDVNARLDIIANGRGGEIISMRDRLDRLKKQSA